MNNMSAEQYEESDSGPNLDLLAILYSCVPYPRRSGLVGKEKEKEKR